MQLKAIRSAIEDNNATCSVFYSRLAPSHFFEVKQPSQRLPLNVLNDKIVLCVSAIGCPNAFIHTAREVPFFLFSLCFLPLCRTSWHYISSVVILFVVGIQYALLATCYCQQGQTRECRAQKFVVACTSYDIYFLNRSEVFDPFLY